MPIKSRKIANFNKKVVELADTPSANMTPADIKDWFDSSPEELRVALNELIDDLTSTSTGDSGAKNIGVESIFGLNGVDIQTVLHSLKKNVDDVNQSLNTNIDEAISISKSANEKASQSIDRANQIIANAGNSNTEIVDGRLRSDGTIAPTIGVHVRELGKKIKSIHYDEVEGVTFKEKITNLTALATAGNVRYELLLPRFAFIESSEDSIEIDAEKITIDGNESTLIYNGLYPNEGYFINIINTVIGFNKKVFKNLYIDNVVSGRKIGVLFGGETTSGMSTILLENFNTKRFYPSFEYRSNAYLIRHFNCDISGGVNMPHGYKNYGENISFDSCTFFNTTAFGADSYCVKNANSNGDFRFSKCSFDYSSKIAICLSGGIIIDNSHIEFRLGGQESSIYDYEAFYCSGDNSIILINGTRIMGNKNFATEGIPNATNRPYIFVVDGGDWNSSKRAKIKLNNCDLWGLETTTNELCGGNANGLFEIIGSHGNQVWNLPRVTKKNNNARSKFEVTATNCTFEKITEMVNGIERNDVLKFTVTAPNASAILKFPTKRPVTYQVWGRQNGAADAYTTTKFLNDYVASAPIGNLNSVTWVAMRNSFFIEPSDSNNALMFYLNRGNFLVGTSFYIYIDEIYEW